MQENKNVRNVEEYVKKVNIYKNYRVTSNRNVKANKKRIYKNNKYIEMHVEKYLFEVITEYIKNRNYINM